MKKINYKSYHRDQAYLENEKHFKNIFQKRFEIARKFKKGKRVLEIGASTGVMLNIFKDYGWKTWGIEPSKSASEAAKKDHKIINNFFEKVNLPNNYFDLVIANHTLEHMDDPLEILKKIYLILRKEGVVYIDVPNFGGLGSKILGQRWPYLLPNEHKHQFTKESLTKIFNQAGFKVVYFQSRSGIFEFAKPLEELWQSLTNLKKRFFFNILTLPYALIATILNMGDSMSLVGQKR